MRARTKSLVAVAVSLGVALGMRLSASGGPTPGAEHGAPGVAANASPAASVDQDPPRAERPSVAATPARVADDADAARLAVLLERDPAAALAEVRRDMTAYPGRAATPEQRWIEVQALVHTGAIGEARSTAYDFYAEHPDHPLADAMEQMTGMHRGRIAENAAPDRAPPTPAR